MQCCQRQVTHHKVVGPIDDGPIPLPRTSHGCTGEPANPINGSAGHYYGWKSRRSCSRLFALAQQPLRTARYRGPHHALTHGSVLSLSASPEAAPSRHACAVHLTASARPSSRTEGGLVCAGPDAGSPVLRPPQLPADQVHGFDCNGRAARVERALALKEARDDGDEEDEGPYGGQHSTRRRLGQRGGLGGGGGGTPVREGRQHPPVSVSRGDQEGQPQHAWRPPPLPPPLQQQPRQPLPPPLQQQPRQQSVRSAQELPGSPPSCSDAHGDEPRLPPPQHRHQRPRRDQAPGPTQAPPLPRHQQSQPHQPPQQQRYPHQRRKRHLQQQQRQLETRLHVALVHARHCLARALAAAPTPASLEALLSASLAAGPRLPLLDPVCVSAAVCRMVRLRRAGAAAEGKEHAAAAAGGLPSMDEWRRGNGLRGAAAAAVLREGVASFDAHLPPHGRGGSLQLEDCSLRTGDSACGICGAATAAAAGRGFRPGRQLRRQVGTRVEGQLKPSPASAVLAAEIATSDAVAETSGSLPGSRLAVSAADIPTRGPRSVDRAGRVGRFLRLVSTAVRQCLSDAATAAAAVGVETTLSEHRLPTTATTAAAATRSTATPPSPSPFHFLNRTTESAMPLHLDAQARGGSGGIGSSGVSRQGSGSAVLEAFLEAAATADAALAAAGVAAMPEAAAVAAPVGRFRPREVANVVWGLACLRSADAQLCGRREDQRLLLRLAEELLLPPAAAARALPAVERGRDITAIAEVAVSSRSCSRNNSSNSDCRGSNSPRNGSCNSEGCHGASAVAGIISSSTGGSSSKSRRNGSSWFSTRWRPGELAMLGWGMAHAGVAPPSDRWLLSYTAAWDERALAAAAPSDLACLAWSLARWQRLAARSIAWRSGAAISARRRGSHGISSIRSGSGDGSGGGEPVVATPLSPGLRRRRRRALLALPRAAVLGQQPTRRVPPPPAPQALLPPPWLQAFWEASGDHIRRSAAAVAPSRRTDPRVFASSGSGGGGTSLLALAGAEGGRLQPHPRVTGESDARLPSSASASTAGVAGAGAAAGAAGGGGSGGRGPGGHVSNWGPCEVAMLVWSVGMMRLQPPAEWLEAALRAAAVAAPAAPPLALATTLRGAARIGACMPLQFACGDRGSAGLSDSPAAEIAVAKVLAQHIAAAACTGGAAANVPSFSTAPVPVRAADCVLHPPVSAALRLRPLRPPPVPCQSPLAAFARSYLGRCTAALNSFGPSQVVDLLAAVEALLASGHMPPPEALPLPPGALLDAATARLQRCYSQGLGARHLLAAAGSLAAIRHTPPREWVDWWLDEMYSSFVGGRLRGHELAAVMRALAAFHITPGPAWRSAFLAAAARQLRHTDRPGLTALAEAMAAAGLRLGPEAGSGFGEVGNVEVPAAAVGVKTAMAAATGCSSSWHWLARFLRVWAGRSGARRVRYYGLRGSPLLQPPTAWQANRLCAALLSLVGPPACWPPAPRAALMAALRRVPPLRRRQRNDRPGSSHSRRHQPAGGAASPSGGGRPGSSSGIHGMALAGGSGGSEGAERRGVQPRQDGADRRLEKAWESCFNSGAGSQPQPRGKLSALRSVAGELGLL